MIMEDEVTFKMGTQCKLWFTTDLEREGIRELCVWQENITVCRHCKTQFNILLDP